MSKLGTIDTTAPFERCKSDANQCGRIPQAAVTPQGRSCSSVLERGSDINDLAVDSGARSEIGPMEADVARRGP